MAAMYEDLCGNCVGEISLTVHSRAILKTVKSTCNGIKKNQMHAYEMSYKCQLYPIYIVVILIHNHFESPNTFKLRDSLTLHFDNFT
jgi:hypothetical protein